MIRDSRQNKIKNVRPEDSDLTIDQQENMPLLAKIPGFQIDIEKLNWHFQNVVKKYDPVWITRDPINNPKWKYGGWSVTSLNGDYRDGWQGHTGTLADRFDDLTAYKNGFRPRWFHNNKTQICTGYLNEVVDMVNDMFVTTSVRIWSNPPGHCIGWHTDGSNNHYSVRLHIPIVTNPDCVHIWLTEPEATSHHLPADGSAYFYRTNITHDTFNNGTTDRYHLIFEAWDVKGIVPGFKYDYADRLEARSKRWIAEREAEVAREQELTQK